MSSRSISFATALELCVSADRMVSEDWKRWTDGSWKLTEAKSAERSDSFRLSPSASNRIVVIRGERRPRSSSETGFRTQASAGGKGFLGEAGAPP